MLHRITTPLPEKMCPQGGGKQHERIFEWIWKTAGIFSILYSLAIGILLVWLPWWKSWDNNYFLYLYPHFRPLVANSFVKWFVVVLGITNVLIGIQEIVRIKGIWEKSFSAR